MAPPLSVGHPAAVDLADLVADRIDDVCDTQDDRSDHHHLDHAKRTHRCVYEAPRNNRHVRHHFADLAAVNIDADVLVAVAPAGQNLELRNLR